MAIKVKKVNIVHSEINDGYREFDEFLSRNYDRMLADLCASLVSKTKNQKDRDIALAKAIAEYFDTKRYDWDFYHRQQAAKNEREQHPENITYREYPDLYNKYNYTDNGTQKVGYHTPSDKKVVLFGNTMICHGCAELVLDITNYCNQKYGFHIGNRTEVDERHRWNVLTIDGKEYKFDMSKAYSDKPIFVEQKNIRIRSVSNTDKLSEDITLKRFFEDIKNRQKK